MTRVIQQSVTLKASPRDLFNTFLDTKKHAALTGAPAKISKKTGGRFSAFGGQLLGRNLLVVPGRLIVQSWRSSGWKAADPDSILILEFSQSRGGGRIDLVHAGVPAHDYTGVAAGWKKYYWIPWKRRLARRART